MTENYYLPVLFTEEKRRRYAEWGIKKEKFLLPFVIITILIDLIVVQAPLTGKTDNRLWKFYISSMRKVKQFLWLHMTKH